MSWETDNGEHEGWVAETFSDGALGGGDSPEGGVSVFRWGPNLEYGDWQHRPASEVTGWVPVCSCQWRGQPWTRVATPDEHDPAARRIYASDEDALYVGDTREVEDAAHLEWREHIREHTRPGHILAEVADLAAEHAAVGRRLATAVARARAAGASWTDIGGAAGITRQSAHERWRHAVAGEPADVATLASTGEQA